MAFEDAVQLARCLRDRSVHTEAFSAYQALREPRVKQVVAGARQVNRSKAATGLNRIIRDALFPALMKKFNKPETFAWLYDQHIPFDQPISHQAPSPTRKAAIR
jgi:FAD-dependent urate hydroxylase